MAQIAILLKPMLCNTVILQTTVIQVATVPFSNQFYINVPKKEADHPSAWDSAAQRGDLDGVLGFWLQSGPTLAISAIWDITQQIEDSLSLPFK